jgi:hypothetical protein
MPTEIENITGEIVRIGRLVKVATPVNDALYHLIRTQVSGGNWRDEIANLSSQVKAQFTYIGETEKN